MKLILVYNANDGLFNSITDTVHKVMSPSTYECRLCQFTYGMTGMLKKWRGFLSGISHEKEFLHRNEFSKRFPNNDTQLPAIFTEGPDGLQTFVSAEEMNACSDLDELISLVNDRLGLKSV